MRRVPGLAPVLAELGIRVVVAPPAPVASDLRMARSGRRCRARMVFVYIPDLEGSCQFHGPDIQPDERTPLSPSPPKHRNTQTSAYSGNRRKLVECRTRSSQAPPGYSARRSGRAIKTSTASRSRPPPRVSRRRNGFVRIGDGSFKSTVIIAAIAPTTRRQAFHRQ